MKIKILIFLILIVIQSGCSKSNHTYQGYVEGELIYLASPYSGILVNLFIHRGQQVKEDVPLFELDSNPQAFLIKQVEEELEQAKSLYRDLLNPRRVPEIMAIQAQIDQVEAQLQLAQIRVQRYQKLYERGATTKDTLDEVVSRNQNLQHMKEQYEARLQLAMEGDRRERINAQWARTRALTARLYETKWELSQKKLFAPAAGVIFDTYYNEGEFVGAQKAIASLLTPKNVRIEFFVPVKTLAKIQVGQKVSFVCDGCTKAHLATISYISPEAEYAPPLIYSRENSDKLVFRIKASIKEPLAFKPGQPVVVNIDHES